MRTLIRDDMLLSMAAMRAGAGFPSSRQNIRRPRRKARSSKGKRTSVPALLSFTSTSNQATGPEASVSAAVSHGRDGNSESGSAGAFPPMRVTVAVSESAAKEKSGGAGSAEIAMAANRMPIRKRVMEIPYGSLR